MDSLAFFFLLVEKICYSQILFFCRSIDLNVEDAYIILHHEQKKEKKV